MKKSEMFDIVAVGVPTLDLQVFTDEAFLTRHGLKKSLDVPMTPEALERALGDAGGTVTRSAGGPGLNVAAGVTLNGGRAALVGKIANDEAGRFFAEDTAARRVDFMPLLTPGGQTTRVLVATTPDKERTFATVGDAGFTLAPEDIDEKLIARARTVYLDAYLWTSPQGRAAAHRAAALGRAHGARVALGLNNTDLVTDHRQDILTLAGAHLDYLVGDHAEFAALAGEKDMRAIAARLKPFNIICGITRGREGADVVQEGRITRVPARPVANVVDSSGAGDQFASGFIHALGRGDFAEDAAEQGHARAAKVLLHAGAAPAMPPKRRGNLAAKF
jgi:sugar/nucleoside kinase (ribokinase family)